MSPLAYQIIKTNGINLHVAIAGPAGGNPVILLHGFPDASFGWENQINALAEAGFRVIASDQRGYNLSDKPAGRGSYAMSACVADIIGVADALGIGQFNLAGHDFGAAVSWALVTYHPDRVKRLAILNVPHPSVMKRYLKENAVQRRKSWYMFFFQIPFLPERLMRIDNWRAMASTMRDSYTETELDRYRGAWSQPGAITAMLNWYRNVFQSSRSTSLQAPITVPTLIIWGKQDKHLMWQMADESIALCTNGRLQYLEDASHWVMQDKPQDVCRLLIEHFSS